MPSSTVFPGLSMPALSRLAVHNRRWASRMATWRQLAPVPWQGVGLVLSPQLRGLCETCLPVAEFYADLRCLAGCYLPSPSWTPSLLRGCQYHTAAAIGPDVPPSLPDFWATLPLALNHRVTYAPEELLALFCALADPPRFGTDSGRYPAQLARLASLFRSWPSGGRPLRLLDIGCGAGLNTLEIAAMGREWLGDGLQVLGITSEPLEAWMARRRCLPHDPARQRRLQRYGADLPVEFAASRFQDYVAPGLFDIIVCNGLAGGRFLCRRQDLDVFLETCLRSLQPRGSVFLANHFHDGCRASCEHLLERARQRGLRVQGAWQDARLETPA